MHTVGTVHFSRIGCACQKSGNRFGVGRQPERQTRRPELVNDLLKLLLLKLRQRQLDHRNQQKRVHKVHTARSSGANLYGTVQHCCRTAIDTASSSDQPRTNRRGRAAAASTSSSSRETLLQSFRVTRDSHRKMRERGREKEKRPTSKREYVLGAIPRGASATAAAVP